MPSGSSLPSSKRLCVGRATALHLAVRYGKRYAFTFNALGCVFRSRDCVSAPASDVTALSGQVYPYFDPNIHLNPGTVDKCNLDLPRVICWDKPTCLGPNIMATRLKVNSRQHPTTKDFPP